MKKSFRFSTVLVAAALSVALLAGAGFAGTKLGVFDFMTGITPLEGAEELVGTDLGTVENDLVKLTVEEAVFDGQGALVQLRITPKDTEKYAMYADFLQDATEDVYNIKNEPEAVPEGTQTVEREDGIYTIVNEGGSFKLLLNDAEVEIPASIEAAEEQGTPVFQKDGALYYTQYSYQVLGRVDGREMLEYWPRLRIAGESADAEALGEEIYFDTMDAVGQEDGSVIVRASGYAADALNVDALEIVCGASIYQDGEEVSLDELTLSLPLNDAVRSVRLVPVGDGTGERFQILSGSIRFTKVRGYYTLNYSYQQAESGEEMGIFFRIYDADGNQITQGSGECVENDGVYCETGEMQSLEELPETIYLEAKVVGEDRTLGRVECRVEEE